MEGQVVILPPIRRALWHATSVMFDHFYFDFIFLILNRFEQDLPIKDALYATTNFILIIRRIIIMRKQGK